MISTSSKTVNPSPTRIYGGILADDTGSGKTITTLGLIHSHPFSKEKEEDRKKRFLDLESFHQSRASLIVCPENVPLQWIEEAQRCNPTFKIISFFKSEEAKKVTLEEILAADLIVTSYQFLAYISGIRFVEAEGFVDFERVHFYRLVLDEIHEFKSNGSKLSILLTKLRADHVWGLTGTPNLESLEYFLDYFHISRTLKEILRINVYAHNEFFQKFIKRNEPDLNLPPIENEVVWVELGPCERIILNWKSERASLSTKLMVCSHYQLADNPSLETFMTLENAKSKMIEAKLEEVKLYQRQITETLENIESEKMKTYVSMCVMDGLSRQMKSLQQKLNEAERRLNYCTSVFKLIENPELNECLICHDIIEAIDCQFCHVRTFFVLTVFYPPLNSVVRMNAHFVDKLYAVVRRTF